MNNLGTANLIDSEETPFYDKLFNQIWLIYRRRIEKLIIYTKGRWASTFGFYVFYIMRLVYSGGFFVVTYIISLFFLHLTVQFLIPIGLPDIDEEDDDQQFINELPLAQDDLEFKPLIRSLSEFKYWQYLTILIIVGHFSISFEVLDLPVFWPFLLMYFLILCFITIRKLYKHMQKYGYSFWSFFDIGKNKYQRVVKD